MSRLESVTCPACGVEFRREDVPKNHMCPVCGAHLFGSPGHPAGETAAAPPPKPVKKYSRGTKFMAWFLFLAMVVAFYWSDHTVKKNAEERKRAAETAAMEAKTAHLKPGQCMTEGGFFAAVNEDILDRVTTYLRQRDMAAIKKLMDAGLVITLAKGKTVYAEHSWGKVKIRPPGEFVELWADSAAVTCKW